jgi:dihydrofolate reductase
MSLLNKGEVFPLVTLVAALARKSRAIGINNTLPWRLPADLAYFKRMTVDKTILMGRKTYVSIGRPLPKRRNVVLTRNRQWRAEGVDVCHNFIEALKLPSLDQEMMVIGGSEIYRQALPYASRMLLTWVDWEGDADAFFPEINLKKWRVESSQYFTKDDQNECGYEFVDLRLSD